MPPVARLGSPEGTNAIEPGPPKPVLSTAPSDAALVVRCAVSSPAPLNAFEARLEPQMSPSALYDMEREGAVGRGEAADEGVRSPFGCDEAVREGLLAEETPMGRSEDGEERWFAVDVSPFAAPPTGCWAV